ncbi:MAG: biotin/lipoyl-binding protein, partial [bacterium]
MPRRLIIAVVVIAVVGLSGYLIWRRDHRPDFFTGVVEGEERVIRAEVSGRVLTIAFGEGDAVPAGAAIATLDDRDITARLNAKTQSLNVMDAEIARQEEQVAMA